MTFVTVYLRLFSFALSKEGEEDAKGELRFRGKRIGRVRVEGEDGRQLREMGTVRGKVSRSGQY